MMKISAKKFAELNDIEVSDIKDFTDACVGAEGLTDDVELDIEIEGGEITVRRYDNKWNDGIEVVAGKAENWNYPIMRNEALA
jgi:hypothetical protein